MKKNINIAIGILILVLTVAMFSGCIQERYTIDEKGIGKDYYISNDPDMLDAMMPIIIGVIVIVVIAVFGWLIYWVVSDDKQKESNKQKELDELYELVSDGKLSDVIYKELRFDIEDRYKRKWYE